MYQSACKDELMLKKIIVLFPCIILLIASYSTIVYAHQTSNNSINNPIHAQISSPYADAGGPYQGKTNIPVLFDGSNSQDSTYNLISYTWYCGDGRIESGKTATHMYKHPGTYTLLLTVINEDNQCSTDITTVIITTDDRPNISLSNPLNHSIFFRDFYFIPINGTSIIIGPCNISVQANDDIGIKQVEFYIDNELQEIDNEAPYCWLWKSGIFKHTIKAVAIDTSGQASSISLPIIKWKFHPLLLLIILSRISNSKEITLFDWLDNDQNIIQILLYLLQNLNDPMVMDNPSIIDVIDIIRNGNNDNKIDTILHIFEDHPIIKNNFISKYPLLYLYLSIKSSPSYTSSTGFFPDKPILKIITISILLKILFKNNFPLFDQPTINNDGLLQWMNNHPLLSLGCIILLASFLQRKTSSYDRNVDDNADTENRNPHAIIKAPNEAVIYESIQLTAESSYDEDGDIIEYQWEFGDGSKSIGRTVNHEYAKPGIYTITLIVTDGEGGTGKDTFQVTIYSSLNELNNDSEKNENGQFLIITVASIMILFVGVMLYIFRRKLFK